MPVLISRNDITKLEVDAIVNAANTRLQMGGGVCGAIFKVAGETKLQEACNLLAPIETGEAVITDGFKSRARYIIHTAGPIYKEGDAQQETQLYNCYQNSLKLAAAKQLESVAFPLISSGIYGYPPDRALSTALKSIHDFLGSYDSSMTVYMIVYNNDAFAAAQKLYSSVESYIDERFIDDDTAERKRRLKFGLNERRSRKSEKPSARASTSCEDIAEESITFDNCNMTQDSMPQPCKEPNDSINAILANLEDSFNKQLFRFIRQKKVYRSNCRLRSIANADEQRA